MTMACRRNYRGQRGFFGVVPLPTVMFWTCYFPLHARYHQASRNPDVPSALVGLNGLDCLQGTPGLRKRSMGSKETLSHQCSMLWFWRVPRIALVVLNLVVVLNNTAEGARDSSFLATPPALSAEPAFVSINCGGGEYKDPKTGIVYEADHFVSSGRAWNVKTPPKATQTPIPVVSSLRVFDLPLSCYVIPCSPGRYLVRLTFYYGNYDGQSSPPVFNISVGTTYVGTIVLQADPVITELITHVGLPDLTICFASEMIGKPLVNTIEIRQLPELSYSLGSPAATEDNVLLLWWRLHCGAPETAPTNLSASLRYPYDPYDRIWDPDWVLSTGFVTPWSVSVQLGPSASAPTGVRATLAAVPPPPSRPGYTNASSASSLDPNAAPPFVRGQARTVRGPLSSGWPPWGRSSLTYTFTGLDSLGQHTYQVYLYFSNIFPGSRRPGQQVFDIIGNGTVVVRNFDLANAAAGSYGVVVTIPMSFNASSPPDGSSYPIWQLELRPSANSVIGVPMLSGFELFEVFPTFPGTLAAEALALKAFQKALGNPPTLESWQGHDPCQPVVWTGLQCDFNDNNSFIYGMYLQNFNLTGPIVPDLGNLSHLQVLWMYNNHLDGEIPSTFGKFSGIRTIQLQNNNLSGVVPASLAQLTAPPLFELNLANNNLSGPFPFNTSTRILQIDVVGNPDLCSPFKNVTPYSTGLYGLPRCGLQPAPSVPLPVPPPAPAPSPSRTPPPLVSAPLSPSGGNTSHPPKPRSGGGNSLAIIVSLVCAVVVAIASLATIAVLFLRRRLKQRRAMEIAKGSSGEFKKGDTMSGISYVLPGGMPGGAGGSGVQYLLAHSSSSSLVPKNVNGLLPSGGAGVGGGTPLLLPPLTHSRIRCMGLGDVEAATAGFCPGSLIGSGGFGPVFRGVLSDGTPVAVKKRALNSQQGSKEFCNELELLSRAHHPHLVSLLGYCCDGGHQILVYEFMSRGTVRDYLYDAAGAPLGRLRWLQRLSIAVGAAKGIEYLHRGLQPSIIHRDIKTSNILLDDHFSAKLADFGLSRLGPLADGTHVSTNVKGTAGYLDPEYYTVQQLTDRSDVFSFGVVLLELLSGRQPIDLNRPRAEWNIVDWARTHLQQGRIEQIVDPTLEPGSYLLDAMWKVAETGILCVEPMGVNRPSISDVVYELTEAVAMELAHTEANQEDSNLTFSESVSLSPEPEDPLRCPWAGPGQREDEEQGMSLGTAGGVVGLAEMNGVRSAGSSRVYIPRMMHSWVHTAGKRSDGSGEREAWEAGDSGKVPTQSVPTTDVEVARAHSGLAGAILGGGSSSSMGFGVLQESQPPGCGEREREDAQRVWSEEGGGRLPREEESGMTVDEVRVFLGSDGSPVPLSEEGHSDPWLLPRPFSGGSQDLSQRSGEVRSNSGDEGGRPQRQRLRPGSGGEGLLPLEAAGEHSGGLQNPAG